MRACLICAAQGNGVLSALGEIKANVGRSLAGNRLRYGIYSLNIMRPQFSQNTGSLELFNSASTLPEIFR